MPNSVNIKSRFNFTDMSPGKNEDMIKIWLDIKYRELVNEWNENINEHDTFNKRIPKDTILNRHVKIYRFVDNTDSSYYILINCEWVRDPNNSSFGLYSLVLLDSNKIDPCWVKNWFKYYGEKGYLVMGLAIVECDTLGGIGLLVKRGFWEARDVEYLKIDSTLRIIKSDTSYLVF